MLRDNPRQLLIHIRKHIEVGFVFLGGGVDVVAGTLAPRVVGRDAFDAVVAGRGVGEHDGEFVFVGEWAEAGFEGGVLVGAAESGEEVEGGVRVAALVVDEVVWQVEVE